MKLLTRKLRLLLPPLGFQESVKDPIVHIRYFTPDAAFTWLVTEGSPEGEDFRFFGYVIGLEREWGYFLLSQLEAVRGRLGLPVERDLYFTPRPLSDAMEEEE